MNEIDERQRRRTGAAGVPVRLADGRRWLLAHPAYRPAEGSLTSPNVDRPLDRIFEDVVLDEALNLIDVWEAARALLLRNYALDDDEVVALLAVSSESEAVALGEAVVLALLGGEPDEKTFTRWVRASLLANGLGSVNLSARDLADVLAVLTATNRTIPLSQFADACRRQDERSRLETLV